MWPLPLRSPQSTKQPVLSLNHQGPGVNDGLKQVLTNDVVGIPCRQVWGNQ